MSGYTFAQRFGALTPANIRRHWTTHLARHIEHASGLEGAWDAMADPIAARDLGAAVSASQGRVCHFFALLRQEIDDAAQDGAEQTIEAQAKMQRVAEHRRKGREYGPGGSKERWT